MILSGIISPDSNPVKNGFRKSVSHGNLYVALIHFPVVNKKGETIASAVTNLDLHDIARASRTYGIRAFYVVTPLEDQQILVKQLISHWITGAGAQYNPARREALELIRIADSVEAVQEEIRKQREKIPVTVVTCAKDHSRNLSFQHFRMMLQDENPYLLIFGTAWGISPDFIFTADHILEPVKGNSDYNHLSVRSAVSVILDRLLAG